MKHHEKKEKEHAAPKHVHEHKPKKEAQKDMKKHHKGK